MGDEKEALARRRAKYDANAPNCSAPNCATPAYYGMRGMCALHYRRWSRGLPLEEVDMDADPTRDLSAHEVSLRYARVFEAWGKPSGSVTTPYAERWDALERSPKRPIMWDVHYKYTMGIGQAVEIPSQDSGERWTAYQKWLPVQREVQARRENNRPLFAGNSGRSGR